MGCVPFPISNPYSAALPQLWQLHFRPVVEELASLYFKEPLINLLKISLPYRFVSSIDPFAAIICKEP
jgi:hypothetical protein